VLPLVPALDSTLSLSALGDLTNLRAVVIAFALMAVVAIIVLEVR